MDYADKPEMDVIEAAREGDELAMEYLLKRYHGLMNYICDKYYLKDGERDDLMQEAMIGALKTNHIDIQECLTLNYMGSEIGYKTFSKSIKSQTEATYMLKLNV